MLSSNAAPPRHRIAAAQDARTRLLSLLLLLLLVPVATTAQTPASATAARPSSSSAGSNATPRVNKIEAVAFQSTLVGAALPYNVVLPADYALPAARAKRYPVLYLLHGLGGNAGDWVSDRAQLARHAAPHELIIVVPEGRDAWYTDSATVPADKYETYFLEELVTDVQRRFRTIETRDGRAVAGLSMGGYGALKFGLKQPEMFAFAASMSGALAVASWDADEPTMPEFVKPSLRRVFGAMDSPVRPVNDIFKLVRETPAGRASALPFLYLDCGTEDFLIGSNRDFAGLLLQQKIPHEFRQLPGKHDWPYWNRQVQEVLRLAAQRMTRPQNARAAAR